MDVARVLAFSLVLCAFGAILVALAWANYVDTLRQNYLQRHHEIDIPEAIWFDDKATSVIVPALLVFFVLQLVAPFLLAGSRTSIRSLGGILFWILWLAVWASLALFCAR